MNKVEGEKLDLKGLEISQNVSDILHGDWEDALGSEDFEVSQSKLVELKALNNWRKEIAGSSFRDFYLLSESGSKISAQTSNMEEQLLLRKELAENLSEKTGRMSPRIADIYSGLLSSYCGEDYESVFESTAQKLAQLKEEGDLNILFDPSVSYEAKANRIQTRLLGELRGRKALDHMDRKKIEEAKIDTENVDDSPPEARDESKPSMDEQERSKEWEKVTPFWTISPARGGYFREQCFDIWNKRENKWQSSSYVYEETNGVKPSADHITICASIKPGVRTRVPVPYNFEVSDINISNFSIEYDQNGDEIMEEQFDDIIEKDQNGDIVVNPKDNVKHKVEITLNKIDTPKIFTGEAKNTDFGEINLSDKTIEALKQIAVAKKTPEQKARAISRYIKSHLKYSSDSSFNRIYDEDERGYIGSIDHHRQADCDVANTYFAALCSKLNIPTRHVVGHMVKGKNADGNSVITGGTGHAWSEIFDQEKGWVRIDATPPGDPQTEEDLEEGAEGVDGDFGEEEAIEPSDEELSKLEEEIADHTEKLSYTTAERELAEAAGIELKEARQIVKEIDEAEDSRLPNGKKITDLLSQVFQMIVESRKTKEIDYTGPVRRREGGEAIQSIVAHKIGVQAKDFDPVSRQKSEVEEKIEEVFDGLDLFIVGDKSGSMSQSYDGETKWKMQRKAEYLILSSLYRFGQNLTRLQNTMALPLDVRTMALSFRDANKIDIDKPLSGAFLAEDKVRLWRSLSNQGSGNGDVAALSEIYEQITTEIESDPSKKDRIRVIIACSDGMPDSPAGVQDLAKKLGELHSIVVGIGMTETASRVPVIFNTEYSRGDIAKDIADLPAIVAKHVILEATKLFPDRVKQSVESVVKNILDKFH